MHPVRPHLTRPERGGGWSATVLILLTLLSGCSGTPFGETLSRSFPERGAQGTASPEAAGSGPPAAASGGAASPSPASPASRAAGVPPSKAGGSATPATEGAPKPGIPTPGRPAPRVSPGGAPYRVTIRLPLADPSAPAEVVTEALRSAGVTFEVETIERLGAAAPDGSGAAAAPPAQVRPAPPPR